MRFGIPYQCRDIIRVEQCIGEYLRRREACSSLLYANILMSSVTTHGSSAIAFEDRAICSRWLSSSVMAKRRP